jgi:transposase InsO family protein
VAATSVGQEVNEALLYNWYVFKEVKQNWFGFTILGNGGSGLGPDFARALHSNLPRLFRDFGDERLRRGPINDGDALAVEVNRFRQIYNTIRPHQALHDGTPRDAYLAGR